MDTIRFFNSWVAWLTRGVLAYVKEKASLAAQNPLAGAASLTAFAVFNDKRFLICPGGCGAAFANVSSHFTHVTEPMFNTLLGPVCQIFGLGVINPFSPLLGMLAAAIAGIVAVATVIALSILVKQAAWHGTKLALKFVGTSFSTLKEKTAAWWRGEAKKEMEESKKDYEKVMQDLMTKMKETEEEADARKIQGNLPPFSDDVVGGATTAKPPPEATPPPGSPPPMKTMTHFYGRF